MAKVDNEREPLTAFQLTRLCQDALTLMERTAVFGRQGLSAPETKLATARGAARLARIWAWADARRLGDDAAARQAIVGARHGAIDATLGAYCALYDDIDALAHRALRLEALYCADAAA